MTGPSDIPSPAHHPRRRPAVRRTLHTQASHSAPSLTEQPTVDSPGWLAWGGLAADRVSGSWARNEPPQYRSFAGNGGLNWACSLGTGDHVRAFAGLSRRAASSV